MTPQDVIALVTGGVIAGVATWFHGKYWPRIQSWREARKESERPKNHEEKVP
jgi:hypothetical protein